MIYKRIFPAIALFAFVSLLVFGSCYQKKAKANRHKNKQEETTNAGTEKSQQDRASTDTSGCDQNIWNYVYNPTRLEVIDKCKTVTGIIEESNADDDGDQHMLLKLDGGQEYLLKEKNMKKKNGWLVIEAVCMNNIVRAKVGDACKGYVNHVELPEVGKHVKVTGSYVIDTHNGWSEIHPITKIEVY